MVLNVTLLILGIIALVYIELRNNWVYRVRSKLLIEDPDLYRKLPSYQYMVFVKFWVWDVKKFY